MIAVLMIVYYLLLCLNGVDLIAFLITVPMLMIVVFNIATRREQNIDVFDMVWITAYLFFVIGPLQAIRGSTFMEGSPVAGVGFTDLEFFQSALVPTLFFSAFSIPGLFMRRQQARIDNCTMSPLSMVIMFMISMTGFVLYLAVSGGVAAIYTPRSDRELLGQSAANIVLLPFLSMASFFVLSYWRHHSRSVIWTCMAILSALVIMLSINPNNGARYGVLQFYFPILLILLRGRISRVTFFGSALFGIVVIMPVTSLTSRFGTSYSEALSNISFEDLFTRLRYIDVFDMTAYHISKWDDVLHFGSKTIGVILFFIPREIWTNKPTLTALDIGDTLVYLKTAGTANLSFFIGDEFYSDFSFPGVFIGGLLIGYFVNRYTMANRSLVNGLDIRNFILMSAVPILMRGPVGANVGLISLVMGSFILLRFSIRHFSGGPDRRAILS